MTIMEKCIKKANLRYQWYRGAHPEGDATKIWLRAFKSVALRYGLNQREIEDAIMRYKP